MANEVSIHAVRAYTAPGYPPCVEYYVYVGDKLIRVCPVTRHGSRSCGGLLMTAPNPYRSAPFRASSSSPATSAANAGTSPFAPAASTGPRQSDGAVREQAVAPITPHRLAQIMADADMAAEINARLKETRHVSIDEPSPRERHIVHIIDCITGALSLALVIVGAWAWVTM